VNRRLAAIAAALCLGLAAVAGCSNNAAGSIDAAATRALYPKIHAIRLALKAGSSSRLDSAVNEFLRVLREQAAAGNVSPTRENDIENAVDAIRADFSPTTTTTPTTVGTTTTSATTTTTSTTTTTGPVTTTGGSPPPVGSGSPSAAP
jgi:hypothetical protein